MIGIRRFRRTRDGKFRIRLQAPERELLRALPDQARGLLDTRDSSTFRLFPVAYAGDPEADADYRSLVGNELLRHHADALETLATTSDAVELSEEELQQWLAALEVLRLVLGTQLDVGEEPEHVARDDPRAPRLAVYRYLSWLQGEIVDTLAAALPSGGSPEGP
ncbi:MAG: DUF2017 family protein [Acidimicrobiales bacterium]